MEELLNEIVEDLLETFYEEVKEKIPELKQRIKELLVDKDEAKFMVAFDRLRNLPRLFTYKYLAKDI